MGTRSEEDLLDLEILDAVAGLFGWLVAQGEQFAKDLGIPGFAVKALHFLDGPLAMKELGQRMHCDPSFITGIADTLERRGLAARESDPGDRRVKRLVLTPAGLELKQSVEAELLARMPWRRALSQSERASLLAMIRKMIPPAGARPCPAEEVTKFLATATATATAAAPPAGPAREQSGDTVPAPAAS